MIALWKHAEMCLKQIKVICTCAKCTEKYSIRIGPEIIQLFNSAAYFFIVELQLVLVLLTHVCIVTVMPSINSERYYFFVLFPFCFIRKTCVLFTMALTQKGIPLIKRTIIYIQVEQAYMIVSTLVIL